MPYLSQGLCTEEAENTAVWISEAVCTGGGRPFTIHWLPQSRSLFQS